MHIIWVGNIRNIVKFTAAITVPFLYLDAFISEVWFDFFFEKYFTLKLKQPVFLTRCEWVVFLVFLKGKEQFSLVYVLGWNCEPSFVSYMQYLETILWRKLWKQAGQVRSLDRLDIL